MTGVSSQDLIVKTYPERLEGLVHEDLNITVLIVQNSSGNTDIVEEVFWEPTISYIETLDTYAGQNQRQPIKWK